MADSFLSKLDERCLECEVCWELLNDPRQLSCGHTYCRHCLDVLLKFDTNGTATIKCPRNCHDQTFIGKDETTKILSINSAVSILLDIVNEEKRR